MHSQCCHHLCQPFLSQTLRGTINTNKNDQQLFIPPTQNRRLSRRAQRHLSTNLGGGKCKWTAPNYEVPEDIDFHKTLIVGEFAVVIYHCFFYQHCSYSYFHHHSIHRHHFHHCRVSDWRQTCDFPADGGSCWLA